MVSLHSTQIPHGSCHDIFKRQIEPKKIISALHFLTLKKSELFPFASGLSISMGDAFWLLYNIGHYYFILFMFPYQTQTWDRMDRFVTRISWAPDIRTVLNIPFKRQPIKYLKGRAVDKYWDQNQILKVQYNLPTTTKERDKQKKKTWRWRTVKSYFHRILYWPVFFN